MKNIIIYGAPAAGKGTVCESLIEKYNYKHISTGELFRNLDDNDPFNRKIKETIKEGMLVDDETTAELLKQNLEKKGEGHIILDGFPRNLNQAKILDTFFKDYIVVNISVDEEVAKKRTLGRLTCSGCGKIYNIYTEGMQPKNEGICDICGKELTSRSDDNEKSFKVRYDTYVRNCEKIFEYYKDRNILYMINGNNKPEDTFDGVKKLLLK